MSDVLNLRGIGQVYARLLRQAGVDSVQELAASDPRELQARLLKLNAKKKLASRVPALTTLSSWTTQANKEIGRGNRPPRARQARRRERTAGAYLPGDETKPPR